MQHYGISKSRMRPFSVLHCSTHGVKLKNAEFVIMYITEKQKILRILIH